MPRSGKSSLARALAEKHNCYVVEADEILEKETMNRMKLGEDGIVRLSAISEEETAQILYQRYQELKTYLKMMGKGIVIGTAGVSVKEATKTFGKEFEIYCLAMPEMDAETLLENIREHDTAKDWTSATGNVRLKYICDSIIEESKKLKKEAEINSQVKFYDMSENRKEKIELIVRDIETTVLL